MPVDRFVPDPIRALAADGVAAPTFVGAQLAETDDMRDEVDIGATSTSLSDDGRRSIADLWGSGSVDG